MLGGGEVSKPRVLLKVGFKPRTETAIIPGRFLSSIVRIEKGAQYRGRPRVKEPRKAMDGMYFHITYVGHRPKLYVRTRTVRGVTWLQGRLRYNAGGVGGTIAPANKSNKIRECEATDRAVWAGFLLGLYASRIHGLLTPQGTTV